MDEAWLLVTGRRRSDQVAASVVSQSRDESPDDGQNMSRDVIRNKIESCWGNWSHGESKWHTSTGSCLWLDRVAGERDGMFHSRASKQSNLTLSSTEAERAAAVTG
jgi:hypothetical protein